MLCACESQKANAGMSLRVLQPPGSGVFVWPGGSAEIPGKDFWAAVRSDWHPDRGGAGAIQGVIRFETYKNTHCNAQMSSKQLRTYCRLDDASNAMLKTAMEKFNLSARAYNRIIKVARTVADLEAAPEIRIEHLAEAINYRSLDKGNWGG